MTVRRAFLEAAGAALRVLEHPELGQRWDRPSALDQFSVRGLAGHLVRGATSVEAYLERSDPAPRGALDAVGYYTAVLSTDDLDSDLHRGVRERGEQQAAAGYEALVDALRGALPRLEKRLADEPPTRCLAALGNLVLRLDDYLETRIVELLVHTDDIAVSIGIEPPEPPSDAAQIAIDVMVGVARERHGDLAVIRGLSRRERDRIAALRVF